MAPRIRFKGFTDPWEQRKLGDMGTAFGGLTGKSKEDFGHGAAWFVPYTNVFDNPVGDASRLERVEIDPSQNVVRGGDALFTVSSETPEEVGMSCVWPSDLDNLYLNSFCFGYRQDGTFDPSYLAYMLRADSFRSQVEMLAQGISRFNISKGKVMEIEVPVPDKEEQALIGRFFVDLDNLITLHQRKYDKLTQVKKALLDKMFPKNGESAPELRFKGFTHPWEQRKLGDLVDDIATGKSVNSDDGLIGPGDVGIMKTSCVSYDSFDAGEAKRVVPEERSLVACPVEAKTLIVSRMNTPDRVGACGFVADNWPNLFLPDRLWRVRLRNSADPYLVYVLLTSDGSKEVLRGMASGTSGSMHNIPKESFLGMELTLPESLEEQGRIATQLASLDSLITLHQRKLELLKSAKKSLLEGMFV